MVRMNLIVICAILCVGFAAAQTPCACLYTDQLWGSVDPNVFYFCDSTTNTPVQQSCPTGRGFIRNGTLSGCVPFTEWQAPCASSVTTVPTCTGNNVNQPSEASNPNQFYLCPAAGQTAVLLTCTSGTGFLGISTGYLGCLDWAQWRDIKGCNYY